MSFLILGVFIVAIWLYVEIKSWLVSRRLKNATDENEQNYLRYWLKLDFISKFRTYPHSSTSDIQLRDWENIVK